MIIDLFCGDGRFSGENVISIDFDRRTKPTIVADIRFLPLRSNLNPELCHASPPCTYISKARRWAWGWNPKGIAETLRLIAACYDAFDYLGAKLCSIEQPAGIEQILGEKLQFKYDKSDIRNTTTNFYLNKKALKRSIIPQDVRKSITLKIE